LVTAQQFNSQLWGMYIQKPADWKVIWDTPAAFRTRDRAKFALKPNASVMYHGSRLTTNRWAMRDKDYAQLPPPNTIRVALLGSSYTMGDGVADGETFETLVEDRLNAGRAQGTPAYEILNFGMSGHKVPELLSLLEGRYLTFQPDILMLVAHETDMFGFETAQELIAEGAPEPYEFLSSIGKRAGIDAATPPALAVARLRPFKDTILVAAYKKFVDEARERAIRSVWVHIPMPEERRNRERPVVLAQLARQAGFEVLDLDDIYDTHDLRSLQVAVFDQHPNAKGHAVIAERLMQELARRPQLLTPLFVRSAQP
jgi:hypothetical protein